MNKFCKPAGCYPPHGTQGATLKAWHIQGNSSWTQHAIETSLWTFCFEDRLLLYSSVWPVTQYVAQAGPAQWWAISLSLQLLCTGLNGQI